MTPEKKLLLAEERIQALKKELERANDLIEYYRQFEPEPHPCEMPPSFFAHPTSAGLAMGRLVNGNLTIIHTGYKTWEEARDSAWHHHKELLQ